MTGLCRAYIAAVVAMGAATLGFAVATWRSADPALFGLFLTLFVAAATLKCYVPGVNGTYSPVFYFALLGSTVLSLPEVVVAAVLAGIVQCTYKPKSKPTLITVSFSAANLAISTAFAYALIQRQPPFAGMIAGAIVFYIVNTGLLSLVLTLVGERSFAGVWKHWCVGSLQYYAIGVLITGSAIPSVYAMVAVAVPATLLGLAYFRLRNAEPLLAVAAQNPR
jgi:hypothetical protein